MAKFLDYNGLQRFWEKLQSWLTPANIGAAATSHNHSAANITSGTLNSARLPTIPVTKGGTGATTAAQARVNLGVDISQETINMFADAGYPIE